MDDSLKEIIPDFLDEASAYLDTMNESLLKLEKEIGQPLDNDNINNLFRAAHSLKGASGMLGFVRINKVTHRMESVYSYIRDSKIQTSSDIVDVLLKGLDIINSLVDDLTQKSEEDTEIDEIVESLEGILKRSDSEKTEEVKEEVKEKAQEVKEEVKEKAQEETQVKEEVKEEVQTQATEVEKEAEIKKEEVVVAEKKEKKSKSKRAGKKKEKEPPKESLEKQKPVSAEEVFPVDVHSPKFRKIFVDEVEEDIEKLNQNLLQLENTPSAKEVIDEIFRLSHRIKGSFATFGFQAMTQMAHKMEDTLEILRKGDVVADRQLIDVFFSIVDKLKIFVKSLQMNEKITLDINEPINRVDEWLELMIKQGKLSASAKKEEPAAAPETTVDKEVQAAAASGFKFTFTESEKKKITKLLEKGLNLFNIKIELEKGIPLGFERAFLIATSAESIGEVIKSFPDLESISKDQKIGSVSMLLATESGENAVTKAVDVDLVKDVTIQKVSKEDMMVGGPGAVKGDAAGKEQVQTSIRVDSSRLDQMMNLAGELIIIKSRFSLLTSEFRNIFGNKELLYLLDEIVFKLGRIGHDLNNTDKNMDEMTALNLFKALEGNLSTLSQDFGKLERGIKDILKNKSYMLDLYETTNKLGKVCTGIQTGVMQVRMVPIGPLLRRFNRTVRDVARAKGKKIELKIKGEDTELDKNIIDGLGNPLTHMIRNAADHGVESIEERVANGKPETGTICLSAYHEGSFICVEVADDGNGLNTDVIKRKTLEKGLKTEDELAALSEKELLDLVFLPGFSTAKVVSDISGRGVGMDVVKQKVSEMKGNVQIESEKGEGTKFIIRLPLTLAIITALLVKVGKEIYCIPLESVDEIVCFEKSEIYTVEGTETFKLRGKVLPLLRLEEVFNVPNDGIERTNITIVIIHYNGRYAGLAVDTLIGEQEIVIKPLGEELKNVDGISGASILGDGDLSLILDAGNIIEMAM